VDAQAIQNNHDKLLADTQELSYDRARVNFILEKIAEREKITVTEEEMRQMIMQEASMLRVTPDQLIEKIKNDRERIQELRRRAVFGKTLDFVLVSNLTKNDDPTDPSPAITEHREEITTPEDSIAPVNA
jgi:FKBP-type peptidyl-prolyl cis-trans isomerase (trigger factor)